MKGTIVSLNCGVYSVLIDGVIFKVPSRGIFRKKGDKPVVGDLVEVDETNIIIKTIYPRSSFLIRPLIANISQLVIVFSLKEPEFSYLTVFKYLTYANMNNIKAKIILTKVDLLQDQKQLDEIKNVFSKLDIPIFVISNKTKDGIDSIQPIFKNEITCLMGQSGVGKSSLLNSIDKNYSRDIGEYSQALGRGKHQTKEVVLLPFEGGFIADTPGFSSLDLGLYKEDLAIYFPFFGTLYTSCYYPYCLHISEPKCEVKDAVKENKIPQIAYDCYLKLSNDAIFRTKRY